MLSIEEGRDYDNVDDTQLPYTLLRNLGCGHSGNVEAVQDEVTKAVFARKIIKIPPSKVWKRERTKVFRNEVEVIRGLGSHRHIISVFATYAAKREFALILHPVADGGDLEEYLADYWSIARDVQEPYAINPRLEEMRPVLEQAYGCLALGMAYMHEKKVRHKDVKPRNILIHNDRVIYTDFGYSFDSNGFSRSATDGKPGPLTKKYSAPEVLGHEQRDSSSDIYSLGCVFIDLLSALALAMDPDDKEIHCFSESMNEIHLRIVSWKVDPHLASLPTIITRMTTRNPSKRLCAIHTAREIFRVPELYCSGCAATPIDPTEECVKVGRCIKGPRKGKEPSVQAKTKHTGNDRTPLVFTTKVSTSTPVTIPDSRLADMQVANGELQQPTPGSQEQQFYQGIVAINPIPDALNSRTQLPTAEDAAHSSNIVVEASPSFDSPLSISASAPELHMFESETEDQVASFSALSGTLGRAWSVPLQNHAQWVNEPDGNFMDESPSELDNLGSAGLSIARRHTSQNSHLDSRILSIDALPADMQANLGYRSQRYIRASSDKNDVESLDTRYRRKAKDTHKDFFVTGRVFKMLWLEPDGLTKPGCTRGSTHFSTVEYESWSQEIRTFLVVRNMGHFSQCIPIQTYRNRGATKPGLTQQHHGIIHTTDITPSFEQGEHLTKNSIRVLAAGSEKLERTARVNYGKPYAIEHGVKVLDIGRVVEEHRFMIEAYLRSATLER